MLKIVQQSGHRAELVGLLDHTEVTVVTLAALVVVSHSTFFSGAIEESVFVSMQTRVQRLRKAPNDDLDNGAIISEFLRLRQKNGVQMLHQCNICCTDAI